MQLRDAAVTLGVHYQTAYGRLFEVLVAGDEHRARQDFGRLAAGVPLTDLCDWGIAPALRQIGTAWAAGNLSIAAEHRASAICERLIAARVHQSPGRPRGTAVTATPPGDRHALPTMMAAACLREDRWNVHQLAEDLPVEEVVGLAASTGAALVVLSSATTESTQLAGEAAREIRYRLPGVHVLTGRPGDTLTLLRDQARNRT